MRVLSAVVLLSRFLEGFHFGSEVFLEVVGHVYVSLLHYDLFGVYRYVEYF
jgi:hypothetical protein